MRDNSEGGQEEARGAAAAGVCGDDPRDERAIKRACSWDEHAEAMYMLTWDLTWTRNRGTGQSG